MARAPLAVARSTLSPAHIRLTRPVNRGISASTSDQLSRDAASSDGGGPPHNAAFTAQTRNSSIDRSCWRHDAAAVNSLAAKRLPASLSDPKLPLRHSTAGRNARSDTLLVGSTPSTRAKVHSAANHFV